MAGVTDPDTRDAVAVAFRERICEVRGQAPFAHQREWWAASEGKVLLHGALDPNGVTVNDNGTIVKWATGDCPQGKARFLVDLGAYKVGKSWGGAMFAAGFCVVPGTKISLVGLEYDICEPEFSYLEEFLISERGMRMPYTSRQNRPRDGKMFLDLENGTRIEAKSWERKDSLKGKEIDLYVFCEAFMLPGLECLTDNQQNLRARKGKAIFPTTPDRPWLKELHELGHGRDAEWHCTCGISAEANHLTFDAVEKQRSESLMTREKFAIHYGGKIGDFVGRVYNFQQGDRHFNERTHPDLFKDGSGSLRSRLSIPDTWEIVNGCDTGTFYTACSVAFSPEGEAFVIGEYPNYRYVASQPERDEDVTIPQWSRKVTRDVLQLGGRPAFWADQNSQFRVELRSYGMVLLKSPLPFETRTEISREYFQHQRIWLAPWLKILPFELENAQWPKEASSAGKFARVKDRDHTLDCLEHVLSRRPAGKRFEEVSTGRWIDRYLPTRVDPSLQRNDPHLGRL